MTAAPDDAAPRPHWAVRMNRRNRSVFFALLAGVIGVHLFEHQAPASAWLALALQFALYPQLVYWRALRHAQPREAEVQNMMLDGFCFGLWSAGLGFPLWISFILFAGACVNLTVFMGLRGGLMEAAVMAAGGLLGTLLLGPVTWKPGTSLLVSFLCMAVLTGFLVVFARDGFLRARDQYESRAQTLRQLEEIRLLQSRLQDLALRDPLTGLFNRRHLDEALAAALSAAQRSGQPLALLMIDIDHFKQINDTHGHPAGDAMLQALATLLQDQVRPDDLACRVGGEEFVLVLRNTSAEAAQAIAQRLRLGFEGLAVAHGGAMLQATLSCGIACFAQHGRDARALTAAADAALYAAKVAGRNRVVVAPPVGPQDAPAAAYFA